MIAKLAWKNVKSRPLRATATILVIAVAVALLFCMFSFKDAVYEYIFAVETADSGNSNVLVRTNSTTPRIMNSKGLENIDGVEDVVATLAMYALYDGEYVRVRGFESGKAESLQKIKVVDGDLSALEDNVDNVVVSRAFADEKNVKVGDALTLVNGSFKNTFYVCAIAENDGYFLSGAPYTFIGRVEGTSRLLVGENKIFNEIYLVTSSADKVIETLKSHELYKDFTIDYAEDSDYIGTQADSLSAPVVVAGLGVIVLAVACIVLISLTTVAERRKYVSKLTVIGATRRDILGVFLVETLFVSFIGAVVGSVLAGGLFALLVKLILSSMIGFSINGLYLFGASALGFALSVLGVIIPVASSFRSSVRENEFAVEKKSVVKIAFPIALTLATVVSVVVEHTVASAKGGLSIVNVLLLLLTAVVDIPYIYRAIAKALSKSKNAKVAIVGKFESRNKRHSNLQTLTAGTAVVMLLFMAWTLTTEIFTGYLSEFEDKIFITNVSESIAESADADGILSVDGVKSVTPMVWKQGDVILPNGKVKTVNILGSAGALDLIDFEYITDESAVRNAVTQDGYVVIDKAYAELYGVGVGDTLSFDIDGNKADLIVGGITHHVLFGGNYIVISLDNLKNKFGIGADTVIAVADDPALVAERIRGKYSEKNYYATEALTMYEWDAESMSAVFDLVGTLAIILAVLTYLVLIASAVVSFPADDKARTSLLSAGVSKNGLLGMEIGKNVFTAITSYAVSFGISVAVTASLINALRLFDLYYGFMYNAGIVALVGGVIAVAYTLIPLLLGYKRKYNMLRK